MSNITKNPQWSQELRDTNIVEQVRLPNDLPVQSWEVELNAVRIESFRYEDQGVAIRSPPGSPVMTEREPEEPTDEVSGTLRVSDSVPRAEDDDDSLCPKSGRDRYLDRECDEMCDDDHSDADSSS